eukprot:TRINITY_DN6614_c0_g1_i3.p1 TRINITY_DN6614_c0_g1~~TRINITY_DN6614_c0_g1_i3.p1  ORF type:complete len:369 (-),score=124.16 TRINITY_DN6614_c0_g1_i3:100-1206(-)
MLLKPVDVRQKKNVSFRDQVDPEERRRAEYAAMKASLRTDDYELGAYAFPADGYDYGKHLREGGGGKFVAVAVPKSVKQEGLVLRDEEGADGEDKARAVMLPAEIFASETEMAAPVGAMRNKPEQYGLDLSVDPEIMAALDGEEGFEEIMDDFIFTAQEEGDEAGELDDMFELTDCFGNKVELRAAGDEYDSDDCSDISGEAYYESDDDCRTEFTMTTSRRERGEQGRMLDERFEKLLKDQYDDEQLGELEEEDGMVGEEGGMENADLAAAMEEYIEQSGELSFSSVAMDKKGKDVQAPVLQKMEEANQFEQAGIKMGGKEPEQQEQWDCETIVSTYSNIYNHPKMIDDQPKIKISAKTGLALSLIHI